jgi:hypothetical protein
LKPAITIRMGAARWDATIHDQYSGDTIINMRKLDKEGQRKFIFEVVKACREAGRVVT